MTLEVNLAIPTEASGTRVYVEFDRASSNRGPIHRSRIEANDSNGHVIEEVVD